jgi:exopolysaccharide biosynthesis protein
MAIGGGPALVRHGQCQTWPRPYKEKGKPAPPEIRTMWERHPRTAVGWNDRYYYLVAVDGRRKLFSVGMTLTELARYMISIGCEEAMNLDGGGSSTVWLFDGVVNSPSDEEERQVANALVVVRKPPPNQVQSTK